MCLRYLREIHLYPKISGFHSLLYPEKTRATTEKTSFQHDNVAKSEALQGMDHNNNPAQYPQRPGILQREVSIFA